MSSKKGIKSGKSTIVTDDITDNLKSCVLTIIGETIQCDSD